MSSLGPAFSEPGAAGTGCWDSDGVDSGRAEELLTFVGFSELGCGGGFSSFLLSSGLGVSCSEKIIGIAGGNYFTIPSWTSE